MNPEEINTAVALKLGWKDIVPPHDSVLNTTGWCPKTKNRQQVPNFSGDISAAWEIVEFISQTHAVVISSEHFQGIEEWACFIDGEGHLAEKAPLAICRAFLTL